MGLYFTKPENGILFYWTRFCQECAGRFTVPWLARYWPSRLIWRLFQACTLNQKGPLQFIFISFLGSKTSTAGSSWCAILKREISTRKWAPFWASAQSNKSFCRRLSLFPDQRAKRRHGVIVEFLIVILEDFHCVLREILRVISSSFWRKIDLGEINSVFARFGHVVSFAGNPRLAGKSV